MHLLTYYFNSVVLIKPHFCCIVYRGLAFRDVTVSIERLATTIMYRVGGSRETNTTVLKLQLLTL